MCIYMLVEGFGLYIRIFAHFPNFIYFHLKVYSAQVLEHFHMQLELLKEVDGHGNSYMIFLPLYFSPSLLLSFFPLSPTPS